MNHEADATEQSPRATVREVFEFHSAQHEFVEALLSEQFLYMLYGGAIQGGKTTGVLSILLLLCKVFPGSRWAVVRKDGPSLTRNTIPSFNRIRPTNFITAPSGKGVARCANGSEILFFPESIDRDPDYDRWKGLMVNGFVLEEANELAEATFEKAIERAGTWKAKGSKQPAPYVLLTCNPARNWVMTRFYLPWKNGTIAAPYYFQRATPADNPHLTPAYRESLKNLPPHLYNRFVKGDWDVLDDPRQLISFEWLIAATTIEPLPGKRRMGVDVARFGDDYSAIAEGEGNAVVALERIHGIDTHSLSARVRARMNDTATNAQDVRIDVVGLGAGVVDNCRAEGFNVQEFNSSHSAPYDSRWPSLKFKNKRSWAWWVAREMLRTGQVCIDLADTSRLFQDLAAPMYKVSADKMVEVESKDSLKKRIGRSPDEGDAFVMLLAEDPNAVTGALDLGKGRKSSNKFA